MIITTIVDAHGEVDGCMILANTKPSIRFAIFPHNLGAKVERVVQWAASPTSISQITPRAAGGNEFSFPINIWRLFQISLRNFS